MHAFILNDILIIILLSVFVLYLCHRLHLPIIVGFLLTGVIAGPHGLRLIREIEAVQTLAEIGVVLLMFTIGMELSLRSLLHIRRAVLVGGSLQIALTILVGFAAGRLFGYGLKEAVFGGVSSFFKQHGDRHENPSGSSRNRIASRQRRVRNPYLSRYGGDSNDVAGATAGRFFPR
jgi:Kef-type K+ transport system membrane component KefB